MLTNDSIPKTKLFLLTLQNSCEAIRESRFKFASLVPGISVNVTGVSFTNSVWSTVDVDMRFWFCDMKSLEVTAEKGTTTEGTHLHISCSQIGNKMKVRNANITLENCFVLLANIPENDSLVTAVNSTVMLKSCNISNVHGGSFLKIAEGHVSMSEVHFSKCVSTAPLIKTVHKSVLLVENTAFSSNHGPLLHMENKSWVIVRQSLFENNKAENQSLIRSVLGLVALTNSTFSRNTVPRAAIVALVNKTIGVIESSSFKYNTVQDGVGTVHMTVNGIIHINDSAFANNKGGAITTYNSSNVFISNSWFHFNSALNGAAVFFQSSGEAWYRNTQETEERWKTCAHIFPHSITNNLASVVQTVFLFERQTTQIDNCTFVGNSGLGLGGAICSDHTSVPLELLHNSFTNNSVTGLGNSGRGGAVAFLFSPGNVTRCTFVGNKAQIEGGGIFGLGSSLYVFSGVFLNNTAIDENFGGGGAVSVEASQTSGNKSLSVLSTIFQGNKAAKMGGAVLNSGGFIILHNCTLQMNTASHGGAMVSSSGVIVNSTFEHNSADFDGGALVLAADSKSNVSHCQFSHNTALTGGAIKGGQQTILSCTFCAFYNNTAEFK